MSNPIVRVPAATAARVTALAMALASAASCAHAPARPMPPAGTLQVIEASPAKGFAYPYLIRFPDGKQPVPRFLLVEPNNTGSVSDDLADHRKAAEDLAQRAIGGYVSKRLNLPLLVPVFPRPKTEWQLYTHALDRDTLLIEKGPMRRLDLQLLAMVRDARSRLHAYGLDVDEKVLMTGFSASGTFTNRFTVMHPDSVRAAATGGVNGILMLPRTELGGMALPYPLGLADLRKIAGVSFDADAWRRVPQFIYMGALDENDAVAFDDGYSEEERRIVHAVIGQRMQPDRWEKSQQIYREAGANAQFRTYAGVGHWTDGKVNAEIADFFRAAIATAR